MEKLAKKIEMKQQEKQMIRYKKKKTKRKKTKVKKKMGFESAIYIFWAIPLSVAQC